MEKLWPYADLQLYGPHHPRIFATGWIAQPLQEKTEVFRIDLYYG